MQGGKRHILVMSSWYPTRLDPFLGNFVERFVRLLSSVYEVSVLHTQNDKSISKIEVTEDRSKGYHEIIVYYPTGNNAFSKWWNRRRALSKGMKFIEDVDLIYSHIFMNKISQFVRAKFHYHCPLLVHEHGSYVFKEAPPRVNQIQKQNVRRFRLYIKKIIAVSPVLRAEMKSTFPTTKIDVVPNYVDETLFPLKSSTSKLIKNFVHISTLDVKSKNPLMLLEGFEKALPSLDQESKLTIVSDQCSETWKKWVTERNLENRILFVGPLQWDEIGSVLQENDCLIQTSDFETFGIVIAESWLVGLPVISTSVGIAHELPEFLGLQIKKNDAPDLAEKLIQIQNQNNSFDAEKIREHALQFSSDAVRDQLQSLFENYFDQHE
ncbi:MAG: glycosyltransferase family 4 protein [Fluviicola sp.]